jgi:hypothetical protein
MVADIEKVLVTICALIEGRSRPSRKPLIASVYAPGRDPNKTNLRENV